MTTEKKEDLEDLSNEPATIIRQAAQKVFSELTNESEDKPDEEKNLLNRILNYAKDLIVKDLIGRTVTALSPEAVKMALSYEETELKTLTFKDLVARIKQSYSLKLGQTVCVLKKTGEEKTLLEVVVCDEKHEILLSKDTPWCHLIVTKMDPELLKLFGEKNMLVLK